MSTVEDYLHSQADESHLIRLLLSPTARERLSEALEAVGPEDFYDTHLGGLWGAARAITARGDRVSVRTLLAERDTLPLRIRLEQAAGEPVVPSQLAASIRSVRDSARLRRLVQVVERVKNHAVTARDYAQSVSFAHEQLSALDEGDSPVEVRSFSELVDEFDKSMRGEIPTAEVVPTSWPELNEMLSGGLHAGRSHVVAGRPGEGKSTAGANIAASAAEQGYSVLFVSAEMGGLEVVGRVLAAGGRVEYGEITRQDMSPSTVRNIGAYVDANREMPLFVTDKTDMTIEDVAEVARAQKRKHGLDLLFIDYLGLLSASDNSLMRERQVAHISKSIKRISRELDVAVLTAAQLNRDNVKASRPPNLSDLRESGTIEADADVVLLLHHPQVEEEPTGMVDVIVAKNRHGAKGTVSLRWKGYQARIASPSEEP